jgi:S1-C subfamily serine protease
MPEASGVTTVSIDSDSPASRAGMMVGDAIIKINGKPVPGTLTSLQAIMASVHPGDNSQ